MHALTLAAKMFGLGASELIVILIILLVLYSGGRLGGESARKPGDSRNGTRLTPGEKQVLFGLAAVLFIAIGIVLWHRA